MPLNVIFCAAEASPIVKVGGLGDVVGSLPKALEAMGHRAVVMLPRYGCVTTDDWPYLDTGIRVSVTHQNKTYPIQVFELNLPRSEVPVFLLDNPVLFGQQEAVYPPNNPQLEALRFDVFSQAVFPVLKELRVYPPDILHLHDWHTAPIAKILNGHYRMDPFFAHTATVLTLHNVAHQGIVGSVNRLEQGVVASDAVVAVSPTYAKEILTPAMGAGLERVFQAHKHKLTGILNGIDTTLYNPQTDVFLTHPYGVERMTHGKAVCKTAIQVHMGLPVDLEIPLFGMVSRLVEQKGVDLLLANLSQLVHVPAQFVVIGTGEPRYEAALKRANQDLPNIRSMIGFNVALSHQFYAGADVLLMPSRFEPCGLSQLIAMRYGTLPLVRRTGGLADTVVDFHEAPERATGFVFDAYDAGTFLDTIELAATLWKAQPTQWQAMARRAMTQDWSWQMHALAYEKVYLNVLQQTTRRLG